MSVKYYVSIPGPASHEEQLRAVVAWAHDHKSNDLGWAAVWEKLQVAEISYLIKGATTRVGAIKLVYSKFVVPYVSEVLVS